jgi:hypothetical protein
MGKIVIGLAAVIGAATPIAAQAAIVSSEEANQALRASSVAELLQPVPNSVAILATLDAERKSDAGARSEEGVQVAWHHHHHHHHHWYHHHHHHHHYWHHHHHHHHYWHHHHHHHYY